MAISIDRNVTGNRERQNMGLAEYEVTYPNGAKRKKRLNENDAEQLQDRLGAENVKKARTNPRATSGGTGTNSGGGT